jgi:ketosteroid isomerase-like protein
VDNGEFVRATWEAIAGGDVDALEAVLTPDARWLAVEDGPWNCENRGMILAAMSHNVDGGLSGTIEEVLAVGPQRVLVGFRPDHHRPNAWPLDDGVRYLVLTLRGALVSEMKGCATRVAAVAYAEGRATRSG